MSDKPIHISDGPTYQMFLFGLAIMGLSVYFFLEVNIFLSFIVFPVGLSLFLSIEGILINVEDRSFKRYFLFLWFKTGEWESLRYYTKIILTRTNQSQVLTTRTVISTVSTKTYDIYFCNYNYSKQILAKEFTDYNEASEFLPIYADLLSLELYDEIAEIRAAIAARGRR